MPIQPRANRIDVPVDGASPRSTPSLPVRSRQRATRALFSAVLATFGLLPACDVSSAESLKRDASTLTPRRLGTTQDAKAFLRSHDGVAWIDGTTRSDLETLIDDMSAILGVEALFAGIEPIGATRISALLVFRLPAAAPQRRDALTRFNRFRGEFDGIVVNDEGQDFLDLPLDNAR